MGRSSLGQESGDTHSIGHSSEWVLDGCRQEKFKSFDSAQYLSTSANFLGCTMLNNFVFEVSNIAA